MNDTALHALRAAVRYFEERLRVQEAQLSRLRDDVHHQAAAHARSRWRPLGLLARELRRIGRRLRRRRLRGRRGSISSAHVQTFHPDDYRARLSKLRDSGTLARVRTVALVSPRRLSRVATAVAELIEAMGLTCTVYSSMPELFAEDLSIVLNPRAFAVLPPPERRILWLADSRELDEDDTATDQARLSQSLCVFEAIQPRIAELQARGLVQHQIFHVPLAPFDVSTPTRADCSPMGLPHLLARALHGCGILDDAAFEAATAQTNVEARAIVLCLPESPARFAHARANARQDVVLFPGIRHVNGWKGTALSYRYLARRALQTQRHRLIVWEDDAQLPTDFDARLCSLLSQLEARADEWDLFSGLITDLSPLGRVKAIQPHEDGLLIDIDTVVGMVFGIYGPRALRAMADYRIDGEDMMKNTIDRYLETLGLRCRTLFPPLVGHASHLSSSLWDRKDHHFLSNDTLDPMITRSQLRLLTKIAEALGTPPPPTASPDENRPP